MKKESRDLPGDINLPPGVTSRMIDEQFGSRFEDIFDKTMKYPIEGEGGWTNVNVKYDISYMPDGEAIPNINNIYDEDGNEITVSPIEEKNIDEILRQKYDRNDVSQIFGF